MSQAQDHDADGQSWRAFRSHVEDLELPALGRTEREVLVALKFFGRLTVPAIAATPSPAYAPPSGARPRRK